MSSEAEQGSSNSREVGVITTSRGGSAGGEVGSLERIETGGEGSGKGEGKGWVREEPTVGSSRRRGKERMSAEAEVGAGEGPEGAREPPPSTAVSPVALQTALASLATSTPFPPSSSSTSHIQSAPSLDTTLQTPFVADVDAPSYQFASPLPGTATSARSRSNSNIRSRLSSLSRRLTSSHSSSPFDASAVVPPAEPPRPKQRRRFSRSLPALTPALDGGPVDVSTSSPPPWKGKGRLRRIFAKSPSPPTLSTKASQILPPLVSPSSARDGLLRTRALSAPILLSRAPSVERLNEEQTYGDVFSCSPEEFPFFPHSRHGTDHSLPSSAYLTAAPSPTATVFFDAPPPPDIFATLPRELQIRVLKALVEVCEGEWRREVREGEWRGAKARERWREGEARGRRELIKVGRVSKNWRTLSLDGQLWPVAPSSTLFGSDVLTSSSLVALFEQAGSFVRKLDGRGLGDTLDWKTLSQVISAAQGSDGGFTNLTRIDLTGCFALTASSLNSLLIFSPNLTDLVLLGLSSVNRGTLAQIGASCHNLQKLDVSRCKNLPATSLFYLPYPPRKAATSSIWPRPSGGLRSLKASKLSGMNAEVLVTILDRFPDLETLDVSFNPGINDDAVRRAVSRAPVSLSDSHRNPFAPASTLFLPNLATSSPSSSSSKRVYPSLRHLDLSACALLTSTGLSRLAHSLPTLEILELSRIGPSLRSAGLVEFLSSTPLLRKLDLEDADSLTDDVLFSLAANAPSLTHLLISSCSSFTDVGLSAIATQCEKLRVLEADGTAMGADTARRYIALAKVRAMKAQEEAATAAEGGEDIDPLVRSKYPAVLSVLDSRTVARRLSRELAKGLVRTRNGQRGYWTGAAAGFYLDEGVEDFESGVAGEEEDLRKAGKHALDECDETKVVVRSFYSSLAVDAALALREAKEGEEEGAGKKKGRSGLRSRAMSAPEVWRGDEGRGCIVS